MRRAKLDRVDRRILQGIDEAGESRRAKKEHPLTLLRIAYGL